MEDSWIDDECEYTDQEIAEHREEEKRRAQEEGE